MFEKDFLLIKKCKIEVLGIKLNKLWRKYNLAPLGKVQVNFVTASTIKTLNYKYKGHSGLTDVISFNYYEPELFGELFICPAAIRKNAAYWKQNFCKEFCRVLIHGLLHLAGYLHGPKMFAIQENILDNLSRNK